MRPPKKPKFKRFFDRTQCDQSLSLVKVKNKNYLVYSCYGLGGHFDTYIPVDDIIDSISKKSHKEKYKENSFFY